MTRCTTLLAAGLLAVTCFVARPAAAIVRASSPSCHGFTATIVGTRRDDLLNGTPGNDVVVARGGNDVVRGRGGDDIVCGGSGDDELNGGSAFDQVVGGGGDDVLRGQRGGDALWGGTGSDLMAGGRGGIITFYADQGDDLWASKSPVAWLEFGQTSDPWNVDLTAGTATGWGSDTLRIGTPSIQLDGTSLAGGTIVGTPGGDTLHVGGDGMVVDGGAGDDRILVGGTGATATGGPGRDDIAAFDDSYVDGGADSDQLYVHLGAQGTGGSGDDTVTTDFPLATTSSFDGGDGNDSFTVAASGLEDQAAVDLQAGTLAADGNQVPSTGFENIAIFGADGTTTQWDVTGTDGPNLIEFVAGAGYASPEGPSVVHALGGDDVVHGGGDDDTLYGGAGDDQLSGAEGNDTADGGDGEDLCDAEHMTSCENP